MREARLSPMEGVAASLLTTLAVAWVDHATGLELDVSAFYVIPVLLVAWAAGRNWGVSFALFNAVAWTVVDHLAGHIHSQAFFAVWEFLNHALVYLVVAFAVAGLRLAVARERALNAELSQAIQEVGELKGVLPVCAWCHKVRDDQGYWSGLETYIEARTQASFTHGICPDCQAKMLAERTGNTGELPKLPPSSPSIGSLPEG